MKITHKKSGLEFYIDQFKPYYENGCKFYTFSGFIKSSIDPITIPMTMTIDGYSLIEDFDSNGLNF